MMLAQECIAMSRVARVLLFSPQQWYLGKDWGSPYLIPRMARTQEQASLPYRPSEDQRCCQHGANCQVLFSIPLTAGCGHMPEF